MQTHFTRILKHNIDCGLDTHTHTYKETSQQRILISIHHTPHRTAFKMLYVYMGMYDNRNLNTIFVWHFSFLKENTWIPVIMYYLILYQHNPFTVIPLFIYFAGCIQTEERQPNVRISIDVKTHDPPTENNT